MKNIGVRDINRSLNAYRRRMNSVEAIILVRRVPPDEDELYDLAADPYERVNLAGDLAYLTVMERLAARMWAIMRQTNDATMMGAQYGMFRYAPVGPEMSE